MPIHPNAILDYIAIKAITMISIVVLLSITTFYYVATTMITAIT
jgi:hypothetical protein